MSSNPAADAVLVRNADRMMTSVRPQARGIEVVFADGCSGLIPFKAIPEIGRRAALRAIELPNPYAIFVYGGEREPVEIPWDFARHYCDPSYQRRVETVAASGRAVLGDRIRGLREAAGMTQGGLARAAGIGRVTLVRIEHGEQSPRYGTLVEIAGALGRPVADLLTNEPA